jgi:hypothetical protein
LMFLSFSVVENFELVIFSLMPQVVLLDCRRIGVFGHTPNLS